jgi:hypothetical protein
MISSINIRKDGDGMNSLLHDLLADRTGGAVFRCFGPWHFFWIALAAVVFALAVKRPKRMPERLTDLAFGLYILDFFLMPLAYGQIDVEKLPFHACTAMCVLCFWSGHSPRLGRFRASFVLLGFVSNFVYLLYPAGVMWHGVHPLCYRVVQTLGFHGLMSVACLLSLIFGDLGTWRRHLSVTAVMTAWAMLGNYAYNSEARFYNWFFVVRDPFGLLPAVVSPFVMPVLNIVLFFSVEMAVCAILRRQRGGPHAL